MNIRETRILVMLGLWMLGLGAQTPAGNPQRTSRPGAAAQGSTERGTLTPSSTGGLVDAYRQQWDRMSESERKTILNMGGYTPEQYQKMMSGSDGGQSLLPRSATDKPAPVSGESRPRSSEAPGGNALPNLDRSLVDLDAIRDRYIDRAANSNCPPALVARMADLKWKLGQKGIVISSLRAGGSQSGDFLAIGKDWFKAGGASALELREATIEDILPAGMLATAGTQAQARPADDDVPKMRNEIEALAAACGTPDEPVAPARKDR